MCTVQSSIQQCALSPSFWNIERLCLNSTFVSATTYKINFRTGLLVAYLDHLGDHVHLTEEECQLTTSSSGRCWLSNVLIDRFLTTPKLISGNYIWTWDNNIHVLYTDLCPKSSSFHYHRQSIETVDCGDPGELWDCCTGFDRIYALPMLLLSSPLASPQILCAPASRKGWNSLCWSPTTTIHNPVHSLIR